MHSFSSIYTALIKTFSVSRIVYSKPYEKVHLEVQLFAFSLSLFTFSSFYLPESKPQKLKGLLIDSRSRILLIAGQSYLKLYNARTSVSREKDSTELDCRRTHVIVHQSASDKLAVVHSSSLFGAESYQGRIQDFFLGGSALISCSTSTPINHIVFFLQHNSCIRKPQVVTLDVRKHKNVSPWAVEELALCQGSLTRLKCHGDTIVALFSKQVMRRMFCLNLCSASLQEKNNRCLFVYFLALNISSV